MTDARQPDPREVTGRLWGTRARDWADLQEVTARPVYQIVLERTAVGQGTHYLDVGCGAGLSIQLAHERGASVAGLDASEALLTVARERVPSGDFRQGDLQALPYEDGGFDVVSGFNSFQFASDPTAALQEAGRVTTADGLVAIVVWGDPVGMEAATIVTTLASLLPPAQSTTPGPFSLSDQAAISQLAADAGLAAVDLFDIPHLWNYPDESTAIRAASSSGVAARAMEYRGAQAVIDALATAITPFRASDGSYRIEARFRCLVARPSPPV